MRLWLAIVLAAACGSGGSSTKKEAKSPASAGPVVTAATMRDRVKKFCGAGYQAQIGGPSEGQSDGCDWINVGKWRGQVALEARDQRVVRIRSTLVGPVDETDTMRARALELVGDLFDSKQRAAIERALSRLYQKSAANLESGGWVGEVFVRASTEVEVDHPATRWVELDIDLAREGDQERAPLRDAPGTDAFASPANEVTPAWIADAKVACTELVTLVSKTNKLEIAPPKWIEGELYVECVHPDENIVAQFVVTWAPGTRRLLYLRFIADTPQKKFSEFTDRLLKPLLSPAQLTVARTAAKKAPLDRRYDADGLQMGSRHDTGGFYGESHELEVSVQVGFKDKAATE